jgi:hypothetical protein
MTRYRQLVQTAVFVVAVAACGGGDSSSSPRVAVDTLPGGVVRTMSAAPVDSGLWSLELLHEIQPAEGAPGELMKPSDITMTAEGTVFVAEDGDAHVKVFDANGTFLRRIGQRGSGPGEFRVAWIAARGDTLLVQDPMAARASSFRVSDGSFITSLSTTCCYWAPLGVDGAGRALMHANHSPEDTTRDAATFVRTAFGATAADTVYVWHRKTPTGPDNHWEVRNGDQLQMIITVPLRPREVIVVDPQGGFITAWNSEYLFRVSGDGTDTVSLFGRVFSPMSVSGAEKQAIVDARIADMTSGSGGPPEATLRASLEANKIPDVRPPFERFSIDRSGRVWARRSLADTTVVEFDLFGPGREWLDVVRVPAEVWPKQQYTSEAWGTDRVAVPAEDDEGRPVVRVFRIVRKSS